ncbi:MAG: hypothetical protein HRU35_01620 [Rickettsiaceae bacterium]|nr:hypothetical protein [Rickettsiaceae bacterium]
MNDIIEDLFKELCKLQKNIISQELIECFVQAGYAIQTKVIIDCANMFGVPLDLDECQKIAIDNKHNDLALIIKLFAQQSNNTKITLNNDYDDDGKDDKKDDQKNDQDIIIGSNMSGMGAPDDVNNNSLALGGASGLTDNSNNDGNLSDID